MCLVFHVEHLIVLEYAFERPGHVFHMERSVSMAWLREAARCPARNVCTKRVQFEPNVSGCVLLRRLFKGTALRIKQKSVPRRTYMRRADCLAQRGRADSELADSDLGKAYSYWRHK